MSNAPRRGYKMVHAPIVSSLVDIAEHLAKLECEIDDMCWRAIWREEPDFDVSVPLGKARTHCRKLASALQSLELRSRRYHEDKDDSNIVSMEEPRKNADA